MELPEYAQQDAHGLADLIRRREVSAAEVADAALKAIEYVNPQIGAVVQSWSDEPITDDANAPFAGVPFLIKDLAITMQGRRSEFGSRLAAGNVATSDSTLMQRFRAAGLTTMGRTSTPEMAISTTTEPVSSGPTRNPWNKTRSAGGSSGGAGAAVGSGMVPAAHATDGGGSIRVPASFNGVFGLKPTRGRVSNGPAIDEVWSGFAAQHVLTRTVRDSAALLDAVQGGAIGEPYYTAAPEQTFLSEVMRERSGLRIGLLLHPLNGLSTASAVVDAVRSVAHLCESLGHHVTEVPLDIGVSWDGFVHANAQVWWANTAGWLDAVSAATGRAINADNLEPATLAAYNYGREVTGLALLGAMDVRNTVTRTMGGFFLDYDLLLSPTLPELPSEIGAYNVGQESLDGLGWINRVFTHSPFTAIANVAGLPAMSVPLSMDPATELPIGSQFMAGFGREDVLFGLAGQLERAQPWEHRRPRVWAGA
jgi:amidase